MDFREGNLLNCYDAEVVLCKKQVRHRNASISIVFAACQRCYFYAFRGVEVARARINNDDDDDDNNNERFMAIIQSSPR